jgi:hypothetical protein
MNAPDWHHIGGRGSVHRRGSASQQTEVKDRHTGRLNPKTGNLDKSNSKITAAKHQAAVAGGAKEIPKGAVLYKQGGKMYMYAPGAAADTTAAENFQDSFNDWANQ